MIRVRRGAERGSTRLPWLESRHTFSFGEYYDRAHMGFRALRVLNDDVIAPGGGFPPHSHRDMEIVTYVVEGALEHRDSLGTGSVIHAGEVQRMTAGTGVTHSEYNHSSDEPVRLLQIWLLPERNGLTPGYEQKAFATSEKRNRLRLVASRDGAGAAVTVHQDVKAYLAVLDAGTAVEHQLATNRFAWLQTVRGSVAVGDVSLGEGDAAALSDVSSLTVHADVAAEILLFDLA